MVFSFNATSKGGSEGDKLKGRKGEWGGDGGEHGRETEERVGRILDGEKKRKLFEEEVNGENDFKVYCSHWLNKFILNV